MFYRPVLSFPSGHFLLLIASASCFWQGGFFIFAVLALPLERFIIFLKGVTSLLIHERSTKKKKKLPQGRLLCPLQLVCSRSHNSLQATSSELACVWWRRCSPIRIIFSFRNVELVTTLLINAFNLSGVFSGLIVGVSSAGRKSMIGFHTRLSHLAF